MGLLGSVRCNLASTQLHPHSNRHSDSFGYANTPLYSLPIPQLTILLPITEKAMAQ